jgi:uroporphyrinogen III methyltransferase / synthase
MEIENLANDQSNGSSILSGKRVVVTRARTQASELGRRLREFGAEVIEFPTIAIEPPRDYAPMDRAIERLQEYDWLFFTSVNGVEYFLKRFGQLGKKAQALEHLRVVAIGPETAARLEGQGIHVYLVPAKYQAEGILEELNPREIRNRRILIARAAQARELLPETLREWGATVDVIEAYQTVLPQDHQLSLNELLQQKQIHLITFTSSSTVVNFIRLFEGEDLIRILEGVTIACIGPITAQTAIENGLRAEIISSEFTIPGLVDAIVRYYDSVKERLQQPKEY